MALLQHRELLPLSHVLHFRVVDRVPGRWFVHRAPCTNPNMLPVPGVFCPFDPVVSVIAGRQKSADRQNDSQMNHIFNTPDTLFKEFYMYHASNIFCIVFVLYCF